MAERKLVVVRSPFFAGTRMVGIGEVWATDDPIVKSYPRAFTELEIKSSVEAKPRRATRTRAPRVKRPSTRAKKT